MGTILHPSGRPAMAGSEMLRCSAPAAEATQGCACMSACSRRELRNSPIQGDLACLVNVSITLLQEDKSKEQSQKKCQGRSLDLAHRGSLHTLSVISSFPGAGQAALSWWAPSSRRWLTFQPVLSFPPTALQGKNSVYFSSYFP